MKKLTFNEIEKFASKKGVRRIAVENFLMSMGTNPMYAEANLDMDTRLYGWDLKTRNAIRAGIGLAMKGVGK